MASQPARTIGTRSSNKHAHPGRPDLPIARRPTDVVQAEKAAKVIENFQRAAVIQAGIQRAACIEDDLATKDSTQTQRFKKPNLGLQKKVTRSPQSEDPRQEEESDLDDVDQAIYEEETLVNCESDC